MNQRIKALENCRIHWQTILDAGKGFGCKSVYPPALRWENHCALCEYIKPVEYTCRHCPLNGIAWPDHFHYPCESKKSFYYRWMSTKRINIREWLVKQMISACDLAIKREMGELK